MKTLAHILPAIVVDESQIQIPFRIERTGGGAPEQGLTAYTLSGERVWAETMVDGAVIVSAKLNPGEPANDFAVLRVETSRIEQLSLPMTTDDTEAIAAVVHAYITNGRPAWG